MDQIHLTPAAESFDVKRQMFERFLKRLKELAAAQESRFCPELNPDVIVISADQTMIFEAQNEQASKLLRQKCGWDTEIISARERTNVHPAQSEALIRELSEAGLMIT